NVMLLPDGTVKVLDFGLAKIRDVELTASRTTLGTIGYVAPEQVRGESVDARTDLWAVGIMLYEALTGVQPFRGDHEVTVIHAVLNETQVRPSQVNPALSADVDRVIDSLLQKDPADRYQSANALLLDLDSLRRSAPLVARPRYRAPSRLLRRAFGSRTRSAAVVVS